MRRSIRYGFLGAPLLLVLGSTGCDRPVAEPLPVAVRVERLSPRVFRNEVLYSATLKERRRIALSFKVPGTVKELLTVKTEDGQTRDVQEGDRLQRGVAIACLDDTDYRRDRELAVQRLAQSRSRLDAARATAENAAREYERDRKLAQRSVVPPQELDGSESRRRSSAAELGAAEREVRLAELLLSKAEDDLANCTLRVPIEEAVVLRKQVEPFERVAAARPVFELLDTQVLRAAFGVPDTPGCTASRRTDGRGTGRRDSGHFPGRPGLQDRAGRRLDERRPCLPG
ncbi:MAG: hypothetical protein U0794_22710 [Isosphaeraceae bacterium]